MNYVNLPKEFIQKYLLPQLSLPKTGRPVKTPYWVIIKLIIYRLKTGCQWREIPVGKFYRGNTMSWNTVFYHFNKWSKNKSWEKLWLYLLKQHKSILDMSSTELDGSHTPVKRGGIAVGYQHRKKANTTNILFLTDKQGIPLAISEPESGNHNDLYQIDVHFQEIITTLECAGIKVDGLFMNADAGFDASNFRKQCESKGIIANFDHNKRNTKKGTSDYIFDEELYKDRFSVERTNAWIDVECLVLLVGFTKPLNY